MTRLPSIVAAALAAFASTAGADESACSPGLFRAHGVMIQVDDMARATAFWRDAIGFAIAEEGARWTRLDSPTPVYLSLTETGAPLRDPGEAGVILVFQTADIAAREAEWSARGVRFTQAAPSPVGVGVSTRFADPSGVIHSLLEQRIVEPPPFEEPHVYNFGFNFPDLAGPRAFYTGVLGFEVRTEAYYPPALPLGHADGSFGFMLHERAALRPVASPRREGTGVTLIFSTPDSDAAGACLVAHGAVTDELDPETRGGGKGFGFLDGYGVRSEVWEIAG